MKFKVGDQGRVIRNSHDLYRPLDLRKDPLTLEYLTPGDIVTITQVDIPKSGVPSSWRRDGPIVRYYLGENYDQFIPERDLELLVPETGPTALRSTNLDRVVAAVFCVAALAIAAAAVSAEHPHFFPRSIRMNPSLPEFLSNPVIRTANEAAYISLLALVVSTLGWTLVRYVGRSLGRWMDRRREVRHEKKEREWAYMVRRNERERMEDEIDRKKNQERYEKEKEEREFYAKQDAEKKQREEEFKLKQIALQNEGLAASVVQAIQPLLGQTPQPPTVQPPTPTGTKFLMFIKDATNGASVLDTNSPDKAIRPARKGDIVMMGDLHPSGNYRYKVDENRVNYAIPTEVKVIS